MIAATPKASPTSETLAELDRTLRSEQERLLNEARVWSFRSYGWLDAETIDPEFVGHAMWQTEPPVSLDHLFDTRHGDSSPPDYPAWQKLAAISGADLDGLMNASRMSIGQFLMQARLTRGQFMPEDNFFDLHWMSAIVYLATASERLRELFIAAAFRVEQRQYHRGTYQGQKREWYTTPFTEARDLLETSADVTKSAAGLVVMVEDIRKLREARNELIHELATEIAKRERTTISDPPRMVRDKHLNYAEMRETAERIDQQRNARLDQTIKQLSGWYDLLVRASNETFYIEHELRREERLNRHLAR